MKRDTFMSEFDFSYEELKGLENHYRNMQKKTVSSKLKRTPAIALDLLRRIQVKISAAKDTQPAPGEQNCLKAETKQPVGSA